MAEAADRKGGAAAIRGAVVDLAFQNTLSGLSPVANAVSPASPENYRGPRGSGKVHAPFRISGFGR
jgi:hypothetical protein